MREGGREESVPPPVLLTVESSISGSDPLWDISRTGNPRRGGPKGTHLLFGAGSPAFLKSSGTTACFKKGCCRLELVRAGRESLGVLRAAVGSVFSARLLGRPLRKPGE